MVSKSILHQTSRLLIAVAMFAGLWSIPMLGSATSAAAVPAVQTAQAQPQASSCPPTLSIGSTGQWVRELQYALNQYPYYVSGPYLSIDGDFGPKTRAGVMDFQSYYNLQVDGIVGPQTWGALGYCF
jgi:peptidoglycan hydrolase-like protein with peptidoglycan-binding domain